MSLLHVTWAVKALITLALVKLHRPNAFFIGILVVVPILMLQAACLLLIRQIQLDANTPGRLHKSEKRNKATVDRRQNDKGMGVGRRGCKSRGLQSKAPESACLDTCSVLWQHLEL